MKIDIEKVAYQYNMDEKTILSILTVFIDNTKEDCKALEFALRSKDIDEIKRLAHKLKSSYAYIMVQELVELCNKIKIEADQYNPVEIIEPLVLKLVALQDELGVEIHSTK